jgi:hypothetical protein
MQRYRWPRLSFQTEDCAEPLSDSRHRPKRNSKIRSNVMSQGNHHVPAAICDLAVSTRSAQFYMALRARIPVRSAWSRHARWLTNKFVQSFSVNTTKAVDQRIALFGTRLRYGHRCTRRKSREHSQLIRNARHLVS